MLQKTEKYPSYIESKVEWIGNIPAHWKLQRVKELFEVSRGRVIAQTELIDDGRYPVFSSQTKNFGCLGFIDSYDYEGQYITWTTDGANAGTVFLRSGKFNCTNICGTLKLTAKKCLVEYLTFALQVGAKHNKRIDTNGAKIMSNEMKFITIMVPPINEQESIANYLDSQTAKIDQKIDLLRKKAQKYADLKQALINETVTRGLDKSVPMKDSDVEWIGEVPEHWDIRRIKDVCSINDQTIGANENPQREILYVDISSVNFLHGITSKEPLPLADAPSRARRVVKDGDVIVSTVRTYLRAIANIENPEPNLIVSTGFAVLRPKGLLASYAGYAFRTSFFIERIVCESTGVSYPAINSSEIASFDIPTPPEDEQQLITKYLDKKCSEIDAICSALNKQVNALTELRKTLINDVVTGKIKVA